MTFVVDSNIKIKEQKEKYNRKVSHIRLSFEAEDLKYLIVENENDILELIEHLDYAKNSYSNDIRNRLGSRILTIL